MFYLSVPPFAYADIAHSIDASCRNFGAPSGALRVALEKPFGFDLPSAEQVLLVFGRM